MSDSSLSFNCALVTGGGGGIGKEIARYFISQGKKVIIAGRTESKLSDAARDLGHDTAYYVLDTGDVASIPRFIKTVLAMHPELDCLVNNAGVQRPLDINDFDLAKADQEIDINIRGPMHLTTGLLPHFKQQSSGAVIMNVSSVLGFVPFSVINPVYNGTKAWLHFWSMNLRSQLQASGHARVKVVEIVPPTVATDLHRERADPDDNKKEKNPNALSLEEFMEFVSKGLEQGKETIGAGMSVDVVERWEKEFGPQYEKMTSS